MDQGAKVTREESEKIRRYLMSRRTPLKTIFSKTFQGGKDTDYLKPEKPRVFFINRFSWEQ